MSGNSTKRRRSKWQKQCEEGNQDIISSLPDQVLCHTLSFLPTKYAVGTSILSKRWRYLWTSVANLHFDDSLLFDDDKLLAYPDYKHAFMNFVDRVLNFHSSQLQSVQKLHLRLMGAYGSSQVSAWICVAIMRNVVELDLNNMGPDKVELPQTLFRHEKLVVLKLRNEIDLNIPESVFLPSLEVLHLESIQFVDDANMVKILSGSPVLLELVINRWCRDIAHTLYVRSSSLKRLTVNATMLDIGNQYRVVVDAPNLEFLDFNNQVYTEWNASQLPSLVNAKVSLGILPALLHGYDYYVCLMAQLLTQISNVKVLHLNDQTRKMELMMNIPSHNLPNFHNLTHLEVKTRGNHLTLHGILKQSPNLKVLILCEFTVDWIWRAPEHVPRCLSVCLEVIKFVMLEWNQAGIEMAGYFLKNSMVLKKMSCGPLHDFDGDVMENLLMLPRGSSNCELQFP